MRARLPRFRALHCRHLQSACDQWLIVIQVTKIAWGCVCSLLHLQRVRGLRDAPLVVALDALLSKSTQRPPFQHRSRRSWILSLPYIIVRIFIYGCCCHIQTQLYTHKCMHTQMHTSTNAYRHTNTCTQTQMHTNTNTYTHTHT